MAKDEVLAPKEARRGESVLRAALVAPTMMLVCYWRLRDGVTGNRDRKSNWRDVASNNYGRTNGDWGTTVSGQEVCGVWRNKRQSRQVTGGVGPDKW